MVTFTMAFENVIARFSAPLEEVAFKTCSKKMKEIREHIWSLLEFFAKPQYGSQIGKQRVMLKNSASIKRSIA